MVYDEGPLYVFSPTEELRKRWIHQLKSGELWGTQLRVWRDSEHWVSGGSLPRGYDIPYLRKRALSESAPMTSEVIRAIPLLASFVPSLCWHKPGERGTHLLLIPTASSEASCHPTYLLQSSSSNFRSH